MSPQQIEKCLMPVKFFATFDQICAGKRGVMEIHRSRISNLPFCDGDREEPGAKYETTSKKHFRFLDTPMPERGTAPSVSPHFQHRDLKHIRENQTETTLSFPPHQPIPVIQPRLTHFAMHNTNFKMHSDSNSGTFRTTNSEDFQHQATSVTKPFLPITSFMTNMPKAKYPEATYRSAYTKHEVSPILRAKALRNTGVASTLRENAKSKFFSSSYKQQFQNRWCPPLPPLQSAEQQRVQHSSLVMGDQNKILEKQTTYSSSFRQSGVHSPAMLKEIIPKIKKYRPINLRELPDDKWNTTTSDELPALKCDPVHLVRKNRNLSSVFKKETLKSSQDVTTTNQTFFPKTNNLQFPMHVDGASIRTLSNVEFGRPNLSGTFYTTTSQEQFPSKEVVRPRPQTYPSSHVLVEQEPDPMLTTVQRDFVPLSCRRQELSPSQLQQVRDSHIRPQLSTHDFKTTHNETFVPKPYCKASLDNPPFQHISHMCF